MEWRMKAIARARNGFEGKFGIPRQAGLAPAVLTTLVFEPDYRAREALRGLEGYSHLWLIWVFDKARREDWSPTVRPPRLGGNTRMGVFATRSPFRPNPIGLSCVRLEAIREGESGPELVVSGADLMNGTPILDIKPYLPYTDSRPDALSGFAGEALAHRLRVSFPAQWRQGLSEEDQRALEDMLAQDPRPAYQHDPQRVYGLGYRGRQVRFRVDGDELTVVEVSPDSPS